jgi:hypothetical protein
VTGEPLLSNGDCIGAYFAVVAYPQYDNLVCAYSNEKNGLEAL